MSKEIRMSDLARERQAIVDSPDWNGTCPACGSPSVWLHEGPRHMVLGVGDGADLFVHDQAEENPYLQCTDCRIFWGVPEHLTVRRVSAGEFAESGARTSPHPNVAGPWPPWRERV